MSAVRYTLEYFKCTTQYFPFSAKASFHLFSVTCNQESYQIQILWGRRYDCHFINEKKKKVFMGLKQVAQDHTPSKITSLGFKSRAVRCPNLSLSHHKTLWGQNTQRSCYSPNHWVLPTSCFLLPCLLTSLPVLPSSLNHSSQAGILPPPPPLGCRACFCHRTSAPVVSMAWEFFPMSFHGSLPLLTQMGAA